eukprot:scaffold28755_cov66-Phaeocystis_antarctica.AAC.4
MSASASIELWVTQDHEILSGFCWWNTPLDAARACICYDSYELRVSTPFYEPLWTTLGRTPGNEEMRVRSSSLQFSSLLPELVTIVAEQLDTRSLASFTAASTACLAAAQNELRVALPAAVQRCLLPGRSCRGMDKLVASPHFRLPDDLVAIPAGAFMHCTSLTQLTIPATVAWSPPSGMVPFWAAAS